SLIQPPHGCPHRSSPFLPSRGSSRPSAFPRRLPYGYSSAIRRRKKLLQTVPSHSWLRPVPCSARPFACHIPVWHTDTPFHPASRRQNSHTAPAVWHSPLRSPASAC